MQLSALPRDFYRIRRSVGLSREALFRLRFLDFYFSHARNARLACRRFDLSTRTFYMWLRRFDPRDLTAIDTCTRMRVIRAFSTASSKSAERFLAEIRTSFPFPVKTIQSDNGSEFLGSFDKACVNEKHVFSYPRTPKDNAFVERSHRTDDEEFYHLLDEEPETVEDLDRQLRAWEKTYNSLRPHASLNYLTPAAFLATLSRGGQKRAP